MNSRYKSFIIILTTLFIGFGAGFLTSGTLYKNRLNHYRGFLNNQEKFKQNIGEILKADQGQMEQIQPILDKHFPAIMETRKKCGQEIKIKMDSLRNELKPILSEEQIQILLRHPPFRKPKGKGRKRPFQRNKQ